MSSRRAGRRTALFLLYQWDVTGQPLASLYEGEVDEFASETAEAVAVQAPQLDERITSASEG
jgi:transcription termination factor NusB